MTFQERYEYNLKTDLLGKGGFARVYKARDLMLDRDVAIKVFNATDRESYSVLEEIKKAIRLQHPNLLRYYDVALLENHNAIGELEKIQIGVMELANAGDLKNFARQNPGHPKLTILLRQVLSGLDYLHQKGIIHRDLKPQNILLVEEEGSLTAKISDFGISKNMDSNTASSSMAIGTIEYMAPEQFSPQKYGINGRISTNVDLWSFGIMVHELLTEKSLFGQRNGNTTAEQIMNAILSQKLPDDIDNLPEPFRTVVKKCLVTDAKERVQRASDLLALFDSPGSEVNPGSSKTQSFIPGLSSEMDSGSKETEFLSKVREDKEIPSSFSQNQEEKKQNNQETKVYPDIKSSQDNKETQPFHLTKESATPVSGQETQQFNVESVKKVEEKKETKTIQNPEPKPKLKEELKSNKILSESPDKAKKENKKPVNPGAKSRAPLFIALFAVILIGIISLWIGLSRSNKNETKILQDSLVKAKEYYSQKNYQRVYGALSGLSMVKSNKNVEASRLWGFSALQLNGMPDSVYEQAISSLKAAADSGDAESLYQCGMYYYTGKTFSKAVTWPQKYDLSLSYFQQGAKKDDPKSETMVGNIYMLGQGTNVNNEEAAKYFTKASAHGNSSAKLSLGVLYESGKGVPKDLIKAKSLLSEVIARKDDTAATKFAQEEIKGLPQ